MAVIVLVMGCNGLDSLNKWRPGELMDDLAISRDLQNRLAAEPGLGGKVRVETKDRIVYLTGIVEDAELKERATGIAWRLRESRRW